MVRGPAAAHRARQHQRELLAHPGLADELLQPLRPQRALNVPVVLVGQRRHHPVLASAGGSSALNGSLLPPAGGAEPGSAVRP